MGANTYGLLASAACWSLLLCGVAHGDHGGFPVEVLEHIDIIFGLPATPPDNVYEQFFTREVAENHRKLLRFGGSIKNEPNLEPANFTFWLMWLDPQFPNVIQSSSPHSYAVNPGEHRQFLFEQIIAFCPRRIGVHIQNDGPASPVGLLSILAHHTLPIPEPSSAAILGVGALGIQWVWPRSHRFTKRAKKRGHSRMSPFLL